MLNQNNEHQGTPSRTIEKQQTGPEVPVRYRLRNETIYKLVDHSVGSIALECGYHVAHESSLDILTDVCCDYLKKISTLLRSAYETEEWRDNSSDFVDSLERVFHQVNIPSAANLHQYICKMQSIRRHQSKQAQEQTPLDEVSLDKVKLINNNNAQVELASARI